MEGILRRQAIVLVHAGSRNFYHLGMGSLNGLKLFSLGNEMSCAYLYVGSWRWRHYGQMKIFFSVQVMCSWFFAMEDESVCSMPCAVQFKF